MIYFPKFTLDSKLNLFFFSWNKILFFTFFIRQDKAARRSLEGEQQPDPTKANQK